MNLIIETKTHRYNIITMSRGEKSEIPGCSGSKRYDSPGLRVSRARARGDWGRL